MEVTKRLSEYIVNLKFSDLPRDVVKGAKLCFLDWLGVTLSGSKEPLTHILSAVAEEQGGKPQATLIGRKKKVSLLQAALINGGASHALDFDDVHLGMMGHPSAPVFPAILALGEWKKITGEQFISAFIAGFEAECRVSSIVYPEHYLCGWHATGTLGHFGAAAACANLLGLSPSQTVYALGIAGTQSSGIKQVFGTMCKPFHAGKAAMNGLLAALRRRKVLPPPPICWRERRDSPRFSPRVWTRPRPWTVWGRISPSGESSSNATPPASRPTRQSMPCWP